VPSRRKTSSSCQIHAEALSTILQDDCPSIANVICWQGPSTHCFTLQGTVAAVTILADLIETVRQSVEDGTQVENTWHHGEISFLTLVLDDYRHRHVTDGEVESLSTEPFSSSLLQVQQKPQGRSLSY
jgi:hypothetical protein